MRFRLEQLALAHWYAAAGGVKAVRITLGILGGSR